MEQLVATFVTLAIGISATMLYYEIKDQRARTKAVEERAEKNEKQVEEMQARITKLENANRKRMPNEAMDDMMNGMAALNVLETETDFRREVILNAKEYFSRALAVGTKREEK